MYDHNDVERFAKLAIHAMVMSAEEMSLDDPESYGLSCGDHSETVRMRAIDYARDIMNEFKAEVVQKIGEIKFKAEVKMNVDFSK